jgi:hypothetical protein
MYILMKIPQWITRTNSITPNTGENIVQEFSLKADLDVDMNLQHSQQQDFTPYLSKFGSIMRVDQK